MTVYDMSYLCGCVHWGSKLWTMLDFYSMFRHVVPPRWSWTKEKFSSQHHLSLKKMRGWSWKLSTCSCRVFQWFLVFHPKCRCTNSDANSKFMPRDRVPSLDRTDTMVNSAWWLPRVAFRKPFGRGVECAPLGSKGNYSNKLWWLRWLVAESSHRSRWTDNPPSECFLVSWSEFAGWKIQWDNNEWNMYVAYSLISGKSAKVLTVGLWITFLSQAMPGRSMWKEPLQAFNWMVRNMADESWQNSTLRACRPQSQQKYGI